MYYSQIKPIDIANGKGIRTTIWVSGCEFHCKGCFNEETWDFEYGQKFTEDDLRYLVSCLKKEYCRGLTVLGGEPLHPQNLEDVIDLCQLIKEIFPDKDIWLYTGYSKKEAFKTGIQDYVDVMVTGPFVEEKKVLGEFRGSSNQEIIKVIHDIPEEDADVRVHHKPKYEVLWRGE